MAAALGFGIAREHLPESCGRDEQPATDAKRRKLAPSHSFIRIDREHPMIELASSTVSVGFEPGSGMSIVAPDCVPDGEPHACSCPGPSVVSHRLRSNCRTAGSRTRERSSHRAYDTDHRHQRRRSWTAARSTSGAPSPRFSGRRSREQRCHAQLRRVTRPCSCRSRKPRSGWASGEASCTRWWHERSCQLDSSADAELVPVAALHRLAAESCSRAHAVRGERGVRAADGLLDYSRNYSRTRPPEFRLRNSEVCLC